MSKNPEADVIIRPLESVAELEKVRQLESRIWGESESIPIHQTLTAVKNGGLVLGAYSGRKMIGFQYSFPGYDGQSVYLCSHMLAIDPQFRNRGIGEKLKKAQRELALEKGYSLITWTYDPLESVNGYLNIAKLGGVCSRYIENCYGEMHDFLNSGLPSDRFLVEWHIREQQQSKREKRLDDNGNQSAIHSSVIRWQVNDDGLPVVKDTDLSRGSDSVIYVAVPKKFQELKEKDISAAIEWRLKTRDVFTYYFNAGWQVANFIKNNDREMPVNFYVLRRKEREKHEN